MEHLPQEIFSMMIENLSPSDLINLLKTNKHLSNELTQLLRLKLLNESPRLSTPDWLNRCRFCWNELPPSDNWTQRFCSTKCYKEHGNYTRYRDDTWLYAPHDPNQAYYMDQLRKQGTRITIRELPKGIIYK